MATEQKKSWTQRLKSSFSSSKSTAKVQAAKAKEQLNQGISEASTTIQETSQQDFEAAAEKGQQAAESVKEMAASTSATVQEKPASAAESAKEMAASTTAAVQEDSANATESAKEIAASASAAVQEKAECAAESAKEVAADTTQASPGWLEQMQACLHEGYTVASEKASQGYGAAKDYVEREGPGWKAKLNEGVASVSEKTSQGYTAAKDYVAGARASSQNETAQTEALSWTEQIHRNLTMCMSTVHDKTVEGYELVVGKPTSEVAAGEAMKESLAEASTAAEKESKAMAEHVQALQPKSVKVGGA